MTSNFLPKKVSNSGRCGLLSASLGSTKGGANDLGMFLKRTWLVKIGVLLRKSLDFHYDAVRLNWYSNWNMYLLKMYSISYWKRWISSDRHVGWMANSWHVHYVIPTPRAHRATTIPYRWFGLPELVWYYNLITCSSPRSCKLFIVSDSKTLFYFVPLMIKEFGMT